MPNYKTNDPRGWGGDPKRGAALGRNDKHTSADFAGELTLREIHIDQEGYDDNGTYWGTGDPLYWYANEEGTIDACIRATKREIAMMAVRDEYPRATFAAMASVDPAFLSAYIECALWSSTDGDKDESLDANHSEADLAPETRATMEEDCTAFQVAMESLLHKAYAKGYSPTQAGHDFWLTRNGHGAGFWDRNLGKIGDALTKAADAAGEVNLYVGDNGKIYG